MATQKLFHTIETETKEFKSLGNSMSTKYTLCKENLTINWKGRIKSFPSKMGDAHVIICDGGFPEVKKLETPKKRNHKLMWLLDFSKSHRADNLEQYERVLGEYRSFYNWYGYREWSIAGKSYKLTICNRQDCGGIHQVAAYISKDISNEEILEMLTSYGTKSRGIYYRSDFVRDFLKKEFGIDPKLVTKAMFYNRHSYIPLIKPCKAIARRIDSRDGSERFGQRYIFPISNPKVGDMFTYTDITFGNIFIEKVNNDMSISTNSEKLLVFVKSIEQNHITLQKMFSNSFLNSSDELPLISLEVANYYKGML